MTPSTIRITNYPESLAKPLRTKCEQQIKAFQAAVANAGLMYQYCAPWGNVAKLVKIINQQMESTGLPADVTIPRFEDKMQELHGQCFIERLSEVINAQLNDAQKRLNEAMYREDVLALQDHVDAPYLRGVIRDYNMGVSFRLQLFHNEALQKAHDLPSKASLPMKKTNSGFKPVNRSPV